MVTNGMGCEVRPVGRGAFDDQEGYVVGGVAADVGEQIAVDVAQKSVGAGGGEGGDSFGERVERSGRRAGFDDSVGVEDEHVTACEGERVDAVALDRSFAHAQRRQRLSGMQDRDPPIVQQQRRGMPAVDHLGGRRGIVGDLQNEAGDEVLAGVVLGVRHVLQVSGDAVFEGSYQLGEGGTPVSALTECPQHQRGLTDGGQSVAPDIADDYPGRGMRGAGERKQVTPISASSCADIYSHATCNGPIRRGGGRSSAR